jgi:hypothetical protein
VQKCMHQGPAFCYGITRNRQKLAPRQKAPRAKEGEAKARGDMQVRGKAQEHVIERTRDGDSPKLSGCFACIMQRRMIDMALL